MKNGVHNVQELFASYLTTDIQIGLQLFSFQSFA